MRAGSGGTGPLPGGSPTTGKKPGLVRTFTPPATAPTVVTQSPGGGRGGFGDLACRKVAAIEVYLQQSSVRVLRNSEDFDARRAQLFLSVRRPPCSIRHRMCLFSLSPLPLRCVKISKPRLHLPLRPRRTLPLGLESQESSTSLPQPNPSPSMHCTHAGAARKVLREAAVALASPTRSPL